ncbi:MAG TPA: MBL fold metallo-hydrolase [Candidatus Binatia bacterium]|jgi:L-ascorbate metabolism protein UlaG (beta-lactamase superfamily)|nr:MBL fold metallo-hydrolase [Candidatus Binatia bacterium]
MGNHCCGIDSHGAGISRRSFLRGTAALGVVAAFSALPWEPAEAQSGEVKLTWYGQGTTKIEAEGKTLFIDAFFAQHEAGTPKQAPNLLLLTHGHADHFGVTLKLLSDFPELRLAAHSELVRNLVAYKLAPIEQMIDLNIGGKLFQGRTVSISFGASPPASQLPDLGVQEIIMVPAVHSSSLFLPPDRVPPERGGGTFVTGGEAAGYIIRFKNGFTLYHTGDTNVFEEMRLIGERFKPDLALVPIGGNFTMDPADGAFAVTNLIKPRFVIPIHHAEGAAKGTINAAIYGNPDELIKALGSRKNINVVVPQRGQAVRLSGAGAKARVEIAS